MRAGSDIAAACPLVLRAELVMESATQRQKAQALGVASVRCAVVSSCKPVLTKSGRGAIELTFHAVPSVTPATTDSSLELDDASVMCYVRVSVTGSFASRIVPACSAPTAVVLRPSASSSASSSTSSVATSSSSATNSEHKKHGAAPSPADSSCACADESEGSGGLGTGVYHSFTFGPPSAVDAPFVVIKEVCGEQLGARIWYVTRSDET